MDYSVLALWFGVDILACLALIKLRPGAARVWFCLAGALVGLYIAFFFGMFLIHTFITDGWNRLGAAIWLGPIFAISGGAAGYWLVHWWTEPPQVRP
jgi:hypothetical protein